MGHRTCPACQQVLPDHADGCFWPAEHERDEPDEIDAARGYREQDEMDKGVTVR